MPNLKADVILSSSNDERFPPEAAFDGEASKGGKRFFCTTGMFPQEITVSFLPEAPQGVNLSKVLMISTGIRHLKILKCTEHTPIHFEPILDSDIAPPTREGDVQREQFQCNQAQGSKITFIRIRIESGYAPFATLRQVVFQGDVSTS